MQRVLIGCFPQTALVRVRAGLEESGHMVDVATDVEGILQIAREGGVDLVIVSETIDGGSGSDLCAVLEDLPGHPPLLYVGDLLVPGADAVAPPDDEGKILERAAVLLDGAALLDSVGDVQAAAESDGKLERAASWQVPAEKPLEAIRKSDAPAPASTKVNGANGAAAGGGSLTFDALLRRVRECDYFEILGVGAEASGDEVRAAHARLRDRAKALARESSTPRGHLEEVQSALDEARDVLSVPSLRAAYARNRP